MNHALAFSLPATGFQINFFSAIRSLPPVTLPCFVAAVVFSTMAMANVPSASWGQDASLPDPVPAVAEPVRQAGNAAAKARAVCASCGVVETIRRFEPVGDLPAGYEFTVRMRDGSARVSSIANSNKWLVGDTIMLIGGVQATSN
jgi:hypothetical protein